MLFLDANNDGVLGSGEQVAVVREDFRFLFDDLTAGLHRVVANVPDGFAQTSPVQLSDYGVTFAPTSIGFAEINSDTLPDVV